MAFATTDDVETRLARTLSDAELAAAAFLLEGAQAEIEQAAGAAEAEMDPVPGVLRFIAVEVVCRELANPTGVDRTQEQLGNYSYSVGYRETGGTLLTQAEELLVRRSVGTSSGSVRTRSLIHDVYAREPE